MGRGETVKRITVIIALFLAVPLIAQTAKPSPQMIFSQGYASTALPANLTLYRRS
jgi:hypothetical protein